jgi:hypothetical protein
MPQASASQHAVTLGPREQDWAAAIARGAPPFERLRHPAFRIAGADPSCSETARRWTESISGGTPHRERLLAALDLDVSGVLQAFQPAHISGDQPLPVWAECLVLTIRALPQEQCIGAAGEDPTTIGSYAFLDVCRQLLDWDRLRLRYPFLDQAALVTLARQLVARVLLACGATLELENTTRADPIWDFGRTAWIDRLCGFTGLNFVIGTAIRQWRQNALEILSRTGRDLAMLQQTLFAGVPTGPLVSIEGDLGDRHNDGRSVAVLTFASGNRVVYKPKDLRCAHKFMGLLASLNAANPSVTFPVRQIICREDYTWEEYVEQREAKTEAEAARFFRRFGMFVRVLQLVEGRDFWIDNLRADGDQPVFIDLECILHPRVETSGDYQTIMGLDRATFEESVLATAAVTQAIDIPGFGPQDFGALSSSGVRLLPLGMWKGYRDQRNGNLWLKSGRLYWAPQVAWPSVAGQPTATIDYIDDLEGGYLEAQQLLCRSAAGLRGAISPLAGIGDVPVRVLMRSTWEYLVLLRASLEPTALLDGNARELALASVVSTAPDRGAGDDANWRLARSELDALRILDVPEFYNLPSGRSAMDPSHRSVPDLFAGSAHDRLKQRLDDVESFDIATHLQILRSAVRSIVRPATTE